MRFFALPSKPKIAIALALSTAAAAVTAATTAALQATDVIPFIEDPGYPIDPETVGLLPAQAALPVIVGAGTFVIFLATSCCFLAIKRPPEILNPDEENALLPTTNQTRKKALEKWKLVENHILMLFEKISQQRERDVQEIDSLNELYNAFSKEYEQTGLSKGRLAAIETIIVTLGLSASAQGKINMAASKNFFTSQSVSLKQTLEIEEIDESAEAPSNYGTTATASPATQ